MRDRVTAKSSGENPEGDRKTGMWQADADAAWQSVREEGAEDRADITTLPTSQHRFPFNNPKYHVLSLQSRQKVVLTCDTGSKTTCYSLIMKCSPTDSWSECLVPSL